MMAAKGENRVIMKAEWIKKEGILCYSGVI